MLTKIICQKIIFLCLILFLCYPLESRAFDSNDFVEEDYPIILIKNIGDANAVKKAMELFKNEFSSLGNYQSVNCHSMLAYSYSEKPDENAGFGGYCVLNNNQINQYFLICIDEKNSSKMLRHLSKNIDPQQTTTLMVQNFIRYYCQSLHS